MAVKASSEEEVQNIIRIADSSGLPVTPYSTGKNNQGAAIQSVPGMVLDLSEMTKIIEIDTISRNAVIEPGVTFHDLQSAARKKGLRVLTPIEQPSSASVLATYLEYVPTYSWAKYGDENILTMHVVLPSALRNERRRHPSWLVRRRTATSISAGCRRKVFVWLAEQFRRKAIGSTLPMISKRRFGRPIHR